MRKLYLVRHATPDFKDKIKLCIGHTDIDIGEVGIKESERLRGFFKDKNIDKIFSSPLSRCYNTAKIIADNKIDIQIDERLIEIYMGEWEAIPLKDIKKELGDEPVKGERRTEALLRMKEALKDIMKNTEGDILCVSHAGISCAFIAKCIGADIKTSRSIRLDYGSFTTFEYDEDFSCINIGQLP